MTALIAAGHRGGHRLAPAWGNWNASIASGWEPAEIRSFAAVLLVLVAVIHAASRDHD